MNLTGLIDIQTKDGHYFVSLRNLWLLTYIDGRTGEPIWKLSGGDNRNEAGRTHDFDDITPESVYLANPWSEGASFSWQHHARIWDKDLTQVSVLIHSQRFDLILIHSRSPYSTIANSRMPSDALAGGVHVAVIFRLIRLTRIFLLYSWYANTGVHITLAASSTGLCRLFRILRVQMNPALAPFWWVGA